MTLHSPSEYSSFIAPIETMAAQLEDADAAGWTVSATVWSDALDAYKVLLKRPKP